MAQKQGSSPKLKRANTKREADKPKAGPNSGGYHGPRKEVKTSSWLSSKLEDREIRKEIEAYEVEDRRRQAEDKKVQLRLNSAFTALSLARPGLPLPTQIMLELTLW